jgi:hypothetical protein
MAVKLSPLAGAGWQFFDNLGTPLTGGLVYTYTAGTTTPQATYTSSAGTIANANPIVLDSAGRTANEVWLTVGVAYKFVLQTPAAITIGTYDNISGINDLTGANFAPATGSTSITTLGTITTGVWNATPIGVAYGGTGLTSIPARSVPVANVANTYTWVTPAAGQSVRINAGNTAWEAYTPATVTPTPAPDVQTFNSTATWTKPTGYNMVRIQLWGGGGGGGRGSETYYGGGGGGYNEVTIPISYLASSLTVTIGAAGTGRTGTSGPGTTGGASNVPLATALSNGRSTIYAYGGGGGSTESGGGGGGQLSAGAVGIPDGSGLAGSSSSQVAWDGGTGGGASDGGFANPGASALFGGGGGGAAAGSASVFAGAGGGNSAGTAPGGGGGCSPLKNVNGFDGAAGRVVITCW